MRILVAHKYMYRGGGTATYVLALLEELEKRGHEVVPFTVAYEGTEVDRFAEYYVSPPLGAGQTHYRDMRVGPGGALKLLGRATYSLEARSKTRRLIEAARPDVAYVQNIYNYMSPSVLDACRQKRLPVVMRVPDFNLMCAELHFLRGGEVCTECLESGYKRALRYRCLKGSWAATAARVVSMYVHRWLGVYRAVDLFVTPSALMREFMIRAGFAAERVRHLPSFYPGQVETGGSAEGDYVLYFGRLAPEKGIETLLQAMARLNGETRLVLAGADVDGTRGRLEKLAGELGLGRAEFVGMKQREELDELIRGCLFTVVPSRWYDNAPMAVLESMAHGKPVVGADIGGIPEQLSAGAGLLFAPEDSEGLARQMQRLLGDQDLRRSLGRKAAERVAETYSPEKHCATLLGWFGELIEGRHV